jgi:hypothetical protein
MCVAMKKRYIVWLVYYGQARNGGEKEGVLCVL